jgi:hypothetical protein
MFSRIVLDTCTVRNHIHSDSPSIDVGLIREHASGLRLSVSASAFVELTAQLTEGRIRHDDWKARIPPLDEVLDPRWPCVPNGRQLAWLAGTQVSEPIHLEDESRHLRAYWHFLKEVAPEEMSRAKVVYRVSDGSLRQIRLDLQALNDTIRRERDSWITYIRKMQGDLPVAGLSSRSEEEIFALMMTNLGTDPEDVPGLGKKIGGAARMIARFVAMSLARREPYNPDTEDRKGDAFDLNLLFYLPLPAFVVTGDKRFARGLRATNSPQARQVLTIEEFNDHLLNGTFTNLARSVQLQDDQFRRQSEAAYYRWRNGGMKDGEDWADWFASEPVA